MNDYHQFIAQKNVRVEKSGFEPMQFNPHLFSYQQHCADFAIRQGRSALFLDTGLGKTLTQLEFARQIVEHCNAPVLILTPLAVAAQTAREAAKFGIDARVVRGDEDVYTGICITNYDRMDKFDLSRFAGVVLDESSILKNFSGKMRNALVQSFKDTPYRLACTATPSPNDHTELGNHSEFLGVMNHCDMLPRWFLNDTANTGDWRLKGHAVKQFWDWVAAWSRCISKPSDLGFSDDGFILPPLNIQKHHVDFVQDADTQGQLFYCADLSATGINKEKKASAAVRCDRVADLVDGEQWLIWCDTDNEADELKQRIPDAVEVRGRHSTEHKEESLLGFSDGSIRVLITKPSIAGQGLNFQSCHNMAFVGLSYSYEAFYQSVRRCWRFGQKHPVNAHLVMTHAESAIWKNVSGKADSHDAMKVEMRDAMRRNAGISTNQRRSYAASHAANLPHWIRSAL